MNPQTIKARIRNAQRRWEKAQNEYSGLEAEFKAKFPAEHAQWQNAALAKLGRSLSRTVTLKIKNCA
jgi:hypothetical protein